MLIALLRRNNLTDDSLAVLAGQPHDPSYAAEVEETWDFVRAQGEAEFDSLA